MRLRGREGHANESLGFSYARETSVVTRLEVLVVAHGEKAKVALGRPGLMPAM